MQAFMNCVSAGLLARPWGCRCSRAAISTTATPGEKITVAIVNRKFAAHFFGNESPIGRHIGFGDGPETKLDIEIVGVAEDSLYEGPREGVRRQVFVPFASRTIPASAAFYVRTSIDSQTHVRRAAAQGAGTRSRPCRSTR